MSAQSSLTKWADQRSARSSSGSRWGRTTSVGCEAATWLRMHPDVALALPEPGTEWAAAELDLSREGIGPKLRRLSSWGIIERVGRTNRDYLTWTTKRGAFAWIRDHCEIGDRLPCGHRGLRNLPDGAYACLSDDCSQEFPRQVAREVFIG